MAKALIIPCHNEAERLKIENLQELWRGLSDLNIYLIDDGSTDRTKAMIEDLAAKNPQRCHGVYLWPNSGKGEAIRQGMIEALKENPDWIGYADADFATPAYEILRLFEMTKDQPADALLASRVRLLGREIERKVLRHYFGRVFATIASLTLKLPIYDTQCGAKVFRSNRALRDALALPFRSRWAFDVELIGRLKVLSDRDWRNIFVEVPLMEWRDVKGSKLRFTAMLKAGADLLSIGRALKNYRKDVVRLEGDSHIAQIS
jgi:glycosyltransferase involved in cell wall biosynthesis